MGVHFGDRGRSRLRHSARHQQHLRERVQPSLRRRRYIDAMPAERVVQYHLAGHSDHGTYLLDTHDHPVRDEVWELYEHAVRRFGAVSALVEWDDNIPEFAVLADTADRARDDFQCRLDLKQLQSLLYRLITALGRRRRPRAERDCAAASTRSCRRRSPVGGSASKSTRTCISIGSSTCSRRISPRRWRSSATITFTTWSPAISRISADRAVDLSMRAPSRGLPRRSSAARERAVSRGPREARTRHVEVFHAADAPALDPTRCARSRLPNGPR